MSKINVPWINGKRLMERWHVNLDELYQAIFFLHLPVYNSNYKEIVGVNPKYTEDPREDPLYHLYELTIHPTWPYIGGESVDKILCSLFFRIEDVKEFENKYGAFAQTANNDFINKDARELGRLRREKFKWDDSIKASVHIGIFCNESLEKGVKITKRKLEDKIFKLGFKDLPNTTIEKIWKALPEKYKKKAGRPSKKQEPE